MNTDSNTGERIRLLAATAAVLALSVLTSAGAEASETEHVCEIPLEAQEASEIRRDYAEHYECVDSVVDEWFDRYPAQIERLDFQYRLWRESRHHDLRDHPAATNPRRAYDLPERDVELTAEQVAVQAPDVTGPPARIHGEFQRFFVDRAAARLFVTTDVEGLSAVDISERFAFELEGRHGEDGTEEFFVVDDQIAVVEDQSGPEGARDLVVLDISERGAPEEIRRFPGALPELKGSFKADTEIPDRPPTLREYVAIREGYFAAGDCDEPPVTFADTHKHCRPDGSCYRVETTDDPANYRVCDRRISHPSSVLGSRPFVNRRPSEGYGRVGRLGDVATGGRSGAGSAASPSPSPQPAQPDAAPSPGIEAEAARPQARAAESPSADRAPAAEDVPEGGQGGAGSLSQMMVADSKLFVLTGDEDRDDGWLSTFDLSDPTDPVKTGVVGLDNGPEALQRHGDLLLIAGRAALTVGVITSRGVHLLGEHRQDCPVAFDPVVAEGSIAYRTVIFDSPRRRCRSRLEVIDLSTPGKPRMQNTVLIDRPRGLAMLDDRLFVADEKRGIHVFDLSTPDNPRRAKIWTMPGVQDLVLSDFDLYALTDDSISTFYVGPLFEPGVSTREAAYDVRGRETVVRADD